MNEIFQARTNVERTNLHNRTYRVYDGIVHALEHVVLKANAERERDAALE